MLLHALLPLAGCLASPEGHANLATNKMKIEPRQSELAKTASSYGALLPASHSPALSPHHSCPYTNIAMHHHHHHPCRHCRHGRGLEGQVAVSEAATTKCRPLVSLTRTPFVDGVPSFFAAACQYLCTAPFMAVGVSVRTAAHVLLHMAGSSCARAAPDSTHATYATNDAP